jgi:hypothetical protein
METAHSSRELTLGGARDLLISVSHQLAKQDRINAASGQLHSLSFLMNYANSSRARQLQDDYQLVKVLCSSAYHHHFGCCFIFGKYAVFVL